MPSAARPFSTELVTTLVADGIAIAPITLHAGVSSAEPGEPPVPEPFDVPRGTARLVNLTRAAGRRVVAVGTTVTRALESATNIDDADGVVHRAAGWTDLVLGAGRPCRVVDGLITGWHDAGASHLLLLEAVAGPELVAAAYREALETDTAICGTNSATAPCCYPPGRGSARQLLYVDCDNDSVGADQAGPRHRVSYPLRKTRRVQRVVDEA